MSNLKPEEILVDPTNVIEFVQRFVNSPPRPIDNGFEVIKDWLPMARRIGSWVSDVKVAGSKSPVAGRLLHLATLCWPHPLPEK